MQLYISTIDVDIDSDIDGVCHRDSLLRGWELLAICLSFFPPSAKFQSYLEGHVFRCLDTRDHTENVSVVAYVRQYTDDDDAR